MDENFVYPCDFCSKKFTKKLFYKMHVEKFHKKKHQGQPDHFVEKQQQMEQNKNVSMEKTKNKTKARKIVISLNRIEEAIQISSKDTANKNFTISYKLMRWKCNLCGFVSNDRAFFITKNMSIMVKLHLSKCF